MDARGNDVNNMQDECIPAGMTYIARKNSVLKSNTVLVLGVTFRNNVSKSNAIFVLFPKPVF